MNIHIVSCLGVLYISPFPPYLCDLLKYTDIVTKWKTVCYTDKRSGENRSTKIRDGYEPRSVHLYTFDPDSGLGVTHKGSLRSILNTIRMHGDTYTFEERTPLTPFYFGPDVVEGLYEVQARVVINVLSEIGSGQIGYESDPTKVAPSIGSGGALVEATMSTGKTRIISALVKCFPESNILVVTKKTSVIERLVVGLSELLPSEKVGTFYGKKKDRRRVTVCSERMIMHFDTEDIGLIIYDEVHNASGPNISEALINFNKTIKVGLTGTLTKQQRLRALESIFGPLVDTVTDEEAEQNDMVSLVKVYALSVKEGPDISGIKDLVKMERWGVTFNDYRNKLIAQVARSIPPGLQAIFFVRTIDHINNLIENYLPSDFEFYHGQLPDSKRRDIERRLVSGEIKRLVANDSLSEGVDTVKARVVVDVGWSATDSTVSQRAGRNRRKDEGKSMGVIITLRDNWKITGDLPGDEKDNPMKARASKRISMYRKRKWPILKIEDISQVDFSEVEMINTR